MVPITLGQFWFKIPVVVDIGALEGVLFDSFCPCVVEANSRPK